MDKKTFNDDFWTSIHDTPETRNKDYVEKSFHEFLHNQPKPSVKAIYNDKLSHLFGELKMIEDCANNTLMVRILYFDVLLRYSKERVRRITHVSASRNSIKFPN